jgi:hypothetical protein
VNRSGLEAPPIEAEVLIDKIQALSPEDETQRSMKAQALSIAWVVGQTHWLQYARQAVSISMPLLVTLVFWLIAIFVSFGVVCPAKRGCDRLYVYFRSVCFRRDPDDPRNVCAL